VGILADVAMKQWECPGERRDGVAVNLIACPRPPVCGADVPLNQKLATTISSASLGTKHW
jgi:hypothetical protein